MHLLDRKMHVQVMDREVWRAQALFAAEGHYYCLH